MSKTRRPRRAPPATTPTAKRLERRLAAIKLLRTAGQRASFVSVAEVLGVSREAVRKWWMAYQEAGEAGLRPSPGKRGPRAALDEGQLRAVAAEAARRGARSLPDILAIARERHPALAMSESALRRRLIGLRLWRPGGSGLVPPAERA